MFQLRNRMNGSLYGGAVGDAFGAPYEFQRRNDYTPTQNMEYNTNFDLPPGSFTDDTSMMLCLAESLVQKNGFDTSDQMWKYYSWKRFGYMSVDKNKGCFDIGTTINTALTDYEENNFALSEFPGLTDEKSSGNGGIMRLAPIPIFYWNDKTKTINNSCKSSEVTHATRECLESAMLMGIIIHKLLNGVDKYTALDNVEDSRFFLCETVCTLVNREYEMKSLSQIRSTGYVIHSLEAALYAFSKTDTFEKGMMLCAGLGDDVDTVCCIYGQIAGAYYGLEEIPKRWLLSMKKKYLLDNVFTHLVEMAIQRIE